MAKLHEVLAERVDEVMARWLTAVQGTIAPESLPAAELVDHLPMFLREVIATLRDAHGGAADAEVPEESQMATVHGEQRLRLGFSLDAVVREYGVLRDAIILTGRHAGVAITFREAQIVFDSTIGGIANAVSEYARQRDAELHRQHNEHVAFLAHELRNPLGSATMALRLLEDRGHIPKGERASQALHNSLTKITELVDHALDVARVTSGVELRGQSMSLKELLEGVERAAASDAEVRGVQLTLKIEREVELLVDARLIHSALSNVVRNAIKFSSSGGSVEVRTRVQGDRVFVEVEDSCGGLPPGRVEEAFAPFVRLNHDQKQPGFGLGLAIAKQAVTAHGGAIRVQNLPGKGCIFCIELPLPAPQSAS
ncbi:MAG: sensor histidine kinase [Deltaproteobacteria bacterium]|nr:sensor histidine kinase [Deltaproteobacteria bacterium]